MDRRLLACLIDRGLIWGAAALVAAAAARLGGVSVGVTVLIFVVTVAVIGGVGAVVQGMTGRSLGKLATGLRLLDAERHVPVGPGRGLLRGLLLGVAGLPTAGVGLAVLAWSALIHPQRRGWHDLRLGSLVQEPDAEPAAEEEAEPATQELINLTAMRLAPPPPAAPTARPAAPVALLDTGPPTSPRTAVREMPTTGGWRLSFDTGGSVEVTGLTLIGRNPEPRPGEQVAHLVPLESGDMSLSKTHAQVQIARDGELVVMDRGSTNGSVLIRQGVSRDLAPGRPTTLLPADRVRLGDREMTVAQLD